jgi:hypothetical protein
MIKGMNTATATKKMLGLVGIEGIRGEKILALEQLKICLGNNPVEEAFFPTNGAVAVEGLVISQGYLKAYTTAMATSQVGFWFG